MRIAARAISPGCFYRYWLPLEYLARAGHVLDVEHQRLHSVDRDDDADPFTVTDRRQLRPAEAHFRNPGAALDARPDAVLWFQLAHQVDVRDWARLRERPDRPRLVFSLPDDYVSADHVTKTVVYRGNTAWTPRMRARMLEQHRDMCRFADAVVVASVGLAAAVRPFNPNVYVVGNYLPQRWHDDLPTPREPDRFRIGWTGADSHAMDFRTAGPAIGKWLREHRSAGLYCRGYAPPDLWQAAEPAQRRSDTWMHPEESRRHWPFDVAVLPLVDHAVNRARSDLKFHEYALQGVPVIAGDVGSFALGIEHGRTGLLVRNPSQWAPLLDAMTFRDVRAPMAAAAREAVMGRTIERHIVRWERALTPGHVAERVDQLDPFGTPPPPP